MPHGVQNTHVTVVTDRAVAGGEEEVGVNSEPLPRPAVTTEPHRSWSGTPSGIPDHDRNSYGFAGSARPV